MDQEKHPIVYAWIFARGGSKGLPRKNVRKLGGRPLIAHAIETGMRLERIAKVFVSTDDCEIAEAARGYGAEVPFIRPAHLADDRSPERAAWRHAIEWLEASGLPAMDVLVSLPCTSPLRTVDEVSRGIERFLEGGWDTVLAVSRSNRHPSFNMVNMAENGMIRLFDTPPNILARRQDFKPVYDIATAFYISSPRFIMQADSIWEGSVGAVEIPAEHAIDIDGELDFDFAEFLYAKREAVQ
jgi:N-acylneuraminate cytidylyltransferase